MQNYFWMNNYGGYPNAYNGVPPPYQYGHGGVQGSHSEKSLQELQEKCKQLTKEN